MLNKIIDDLELNISLQETVYHDINSAIDHYKPLDNAVSNYTQLKKDISVLVNEAYKLDIEELNSSSILKLFEIVETKERIEKVYTHLKPNKKVHPFEFTNSPENVSIDNPEASEHFYVLLIDSLKIIYTLDDRFVALENSSIPEYSYFLDKKQRTISIANEYLFNYIKAVLEYTVDKLFKSSLNSNSSTESQKQLNDLITNIIPNFTLHLSGIFNTMQSENTLNINDTTNPGFDTSCTHQERIKSQYNNFIALIPDETMIKFITILRYIIILRIDTVNFDAVFMSNSTLSKNDKESLISSISFIKPLLRYIYTLLNQKIKERYYTSNYERDYYSILFACRYYEHLSHPVLKLSKIIKNFTYYFIIQLHYIIQCTVYSLPLTSNKLQHVVDDSLFPYFLQSIYTCLETDLHHTIQELINLSITDIQNEFYVSISKPYLDISKLYKQYRHIKSNIDIHALHASYNQYNHLKISNKNFSTKQNNTPWRTFNIYKLYGYWCHSCLILSIECLDELSQWISLESLCLYKISEHSTHSDETNGTHTNDTYKSLIILYYTKIFNLFAYLFVLFLHAPGNIYETISPGKDYRGSSSMLTMLTLFKQLKSLNHQDLFNNSLVPNGLVFQLKQICPFGLNSICLPLVQSNQQCIDLYSHIIHLLNYLLSNSTAKALLIMYFSYFNYKNDIPSFHNFQILHPEQLHQLLLDVNGYQCTSINMMSHLNLYIFTQFKENYLNKEWHRDNQDNINLIYTDIFNDYVLVYNQIIQSTTYSVVVPHSITVHRSDIQSKIINLFNYITFDTFTVMYLLFFNKKESKDTNILNSFVSCLNHISNIEQQLQRILSYPHNKIYNSNSLLIPSRLACLQPMNKNIVHLPMHSHTSAYVTGELSSNAICNSKQIPVFETNLCTNADLDLCVQLKDSNIGDNLNQSLDFIVYGIQYIIENIEHCIVQCWIEPLPSYIYCNISAEKYGGDLSPLIKICSEYHNEFKEFMNNNIGLSHVTYEIEDNLLKDISLYTKEINSLHTWNNLMHLYLEHRIMASMNISITSSEYRSRIMEHIKTKIHLQYNFINTIILKLPPKDCIELSSELMSRLTLIYSLNSA